MAGFDGQDGHFVLAEPPDHVGIPQVVRRQDAPEPELLPDPGGGQLLLDAGREHRPAGDRRHGEVLGHDEGDAGIDGVLEGARFLRLVGGGRLVDLQEVRHAGDHGHVAATGEVLGRRQHATIAVAADVGPDHAAQQVQVAAEGADALGRVVGADGDIDNGRVSQVDAHGPALNGADPSQSVHQLLRSGRGESHIGREFAGACDLLTGSALEVGRHQEGDGGLLLETVQQMRDVPRRPAVEHEHAHTEFAGLPDPAGQSWIVIRDIAGRDVGADHLADLLLQREARQRAGRPAFGLLGVGPGVGRALGCFRRRPRRRCRTRCRVRCCSDGDGERSDQRAAETHPEPPAGTAISQDQNPARPAPRARRRRDRHR